MANGQSPAARPAAERPVANGGNPDSQRPPRGPVRDERPPANVRAFPAGGRAGTASLQRPPVRVEVPANNAEGRRLAGSRPVDELGRPIEAKTLANGERPVVDDPAKLAVAGAAAVANDMDSANHRNGRASAADEPAPFNLTQTPASEAADVVSVDAAVETFKQQTERAARPADVVFPAEVAHPRRAVEAAAIGGLAEDLEVGIRPAFAVGSRHSEAIENDAVRSPLPVDRVMPANAEPIGAEPMATVVADGAHALRQVEMVSAAASEDDELDRLSAHIRGMLSEDLPPEVSRGVPVAGLATFGRRPADLPPAAGSSAAAPEVDRLDEMATVRAAAAKHPIEAAGEPAPGAVVKSLFARFSRVARDDEGATGSPAEARPSNATDADQRSEDAFAAAASKAETGKE